MNRWLGGVFLILLLLKVIVPEVPGLQATLRFI